MNYMTVEEAAKKWDYSPTRIKDLCREGKVKAFKFGKRSWMIEADQPNPKKNKGGNNDVK